MTITTRKRMEYDDLSPEARSAIRVYMMEGVPLDEYDEWVRTFTYTLEHVDTQEFLDRLVREHPDIREYPDWDTYHDWYLKHGRAVDHSDSRWPILLVPGYEYIIEDGWHRFHFYVQAGDKTLPMLTLHRKEA